jgi:molybdate/tungstate transport system substrate-binding protein
MIHAQSHTRRRLLKQALLATAATMLPVELLAQDPAPLEVAAAGSIRPLLEGPLTTAAIKTLKLNLRVHAQGADAVAKAIVDSSLPADVFIPITANPMRTVFAAGKAQLAQPIARTEMVIVYSPKSRFAAQFDAASKGKADLWQILQQPGLRFVRSNPASDPSGRAIIFALMLAAKKYNQPDLVERVLGPILNPQQILVGSDNQALLATGEIDAMGSYRIQPEWSKLPYITLANDINLSEDNLREQHPELTFKVGDKSFYPEPLVFYAAILSGAQNPRGAADFVHWLNSEEARQILASHHYDAPGSAEPLHA